jgi:hypothetical protein
MKRLFLIVLFLATISAITFAQTPVDKPKFVFAGLAFFQSANPQLQGFGGITLPISEKIISYTDWDVAATPGDKIPGRVTIPKLQYSMRTGIAYHMYEIRKGLNLYGLGDLGMATNGDNVVGSFAGGGFVDVALGKGWGCVFVIQVERNAITGTDVIPRFGFRKKL